MEPKKGYTIKEAEELINEGGHEEHFHYTYEVIEEKTGKVVVLKETTAKLDTAIMQKLGYPGKMISGSKSSYRRSFPNNMAVFNANLCIDEGKVWHGDIDVTKSKSHLQEIADDTGKKLYVLYEMDARFENASDPLLSKAAVVFIPGKEPQIREDLLKYYAL